MRRTSAGCSGSRPRDCIAIGDGENDIELLDWAGYAIGVAGGHPPLLEQADWVCPPVAEDGVPRTLAAIAPPAARPRVGFGACSTPA